MTLFWLYFGIFILGFIGLLIITWPSAAYRQEYFVEKKIHPVKFWISMILLDALVSAFCTAVFAFIIWLIRWIATA